ncbi:MAG: hypothetical protein ACYTBV_15945, partial [Planctomycetota bacterium]
AEKTGLETVKFWHPTGWINQNWLTHVIFYWLTHESPVADADNYSFNSLVYWKFALYIISIICVFYTARLLGAHPALATMFACFALFIGRSFLDIRPAGFSNMLTAAFMLILVLATYRNVLYLWLIVPLTVFWCNVHGGYVYVFIILVPYVIIHMLIIAPKRWTVFGLASMTWAGLYLLTYKFMSYHPSIFPKKPFIGSMSFFDKELFIFLIILIVIGLVLTLIKKINNGGIYAYSLFASLILAVTLFSKFFPKIQPYYNIPEGRKIIFPYIGKQRVFFWFAFFAAIALGVLITFYKKKLVTIKLRGVVHGIAVGFTAFFAMILFNPFHLTNLTHTFIISVSRHAALWKNVNEWHPAFEFTNPVGTSFPFLILFILVIGLTVLLIHSRFMQPKLVKGSVDKLTRQRSRIVLMYRIFGYAAAVLTAWIVLIGFSFMDLDPLSFIFCGVFMVIILFSVFKNINFIYLILPLAVIAQWSAGPTFQYAGGRYFYPFLLIPAYLLTYIICSIFSDTVKYKGINIILVSATAVVSLIVIIIAFNPLRFKFPEKGLADFGEWLKAWNPLFTVTVTRPWKPNYEGVVKLSYKNLFPVLYIINFLSVIIWIILPEIKGWLCRTFVGNEKINEQAETPSESYQIPKIDLALFLIVPLTVYMAVSSRRFIPVAGFVACPFLAMFADQIIRTLSAAYNFCKNKLFAPSPIPHSLRVFLTSLAAVAVIGFGAWWTFKFKYIYLDPWPTSYKYTSVFMRMTASHVKPFDACSFIRNNKLKGNMFNYWTEGGFIAYGQEPDSATGKTPLQLFMDGRAQAAYEHDSFTRWNTIMAGGEIIREAKKRMRKLNIKDYQEVGKWVDKQLKRKDVWVVLMPVGQFAEPIVVGLENFNQNWQTVYADGQQKLLVDITTPRGKELFDNSFNPNSDTFYPDQYSRSIVFAHNTLRFHKNEKAREVALKEAEKMLNLEPSIYTMQEITFAARIPSLKQQVDRICKQYFDDFVENEKKYSKQDGYQSRTVAAMIAAGYLQNNPSAWTLKKLGNDPTITVSRLAEENNLPPEVIEKVFLLSSKEDQNKLITDFGLDTNTLLKEINSAMPLYYKEKSLEYKVKQKELVEGKTW